MITIWQLFQALLIAQLARGAAGRCLFGAAGGGGHCLGRMAERLTLLAAPSHRRSTPNAQAPRRKRFYSPAQLNLGHLYHRHAKKYLGTFDPDKDGYAVLVPRDKTYPATFYLADSYDPEIGTYQRVTMVTPGMRHRLPAPISLKEAWSTAKRLDTTEIGYGHLGWLREAPTLAQNKFSVSLPMYTNDRAFRLALGSHCLGLSEDEALRSQTCGAAGDSPAYLQQIEKSQLWVWCPEHQFEACEWTPSGR